MPPTIQPNLSHYYPPHTPSFFFLSPRFSPSHTQGPPIVTITFLPANKKVQAVAGQNLKDVALAAKIPIKYNCKKGECGTCEVDLNGKKVRTCVGIVPRGARKNEVTIKVLK